MIELRFTADTRYVYRHCKLGPREHSCRIRRSASARAKATIEELWTKSYLEGAVVENLLPAFNQLAIVDAFCGCGGFALGVRSGLATAGIRPNVLCAVDMDADALAVYKANHSPGIVRLKNANTIVDFQVKDVGASASFAYTPAILDSDLSERVGRTDVFIAGPPCQGHSNLNNLTRRRDPRNLLYLTAIATGIALQAKVIAIENVPQVIRSHRGVVETAKALLASRDYRISEVIIDSSNHSCAQARKRHLIFAWSTACSSSPLEEAISATKTNRFPLKTVIGDLADIDASGFMDTPSDLSEENTLRIKYLFDRNLYELPNAARPVCHQNGHTYPSVYGRMKWDAPAQTVTSGFLCPGRGRFIHPVRPRTLTLREGARIQGFPDGFCFNEGASRTVVSRLIADAVPPPVGAVVGLAAAAAIV